MPLELSLPAFMEDDDEEQRPQPARGSGGEPGQKLTRTANGGYKRGGQGGFSNDWNGGGSSNGNGWYREMLNGVAKLALEAKADAREMKGFLEFTVLLPAILYFIQAGLEAGRKYAEKALKAKGTDLGPPHIQVALQTLRAMAKTETLAKEAEFLAKLEAFWKLITTTHESKLPFFVHVFRIQKPKKASQAIMDGGYAKRTFRFAPEWKEPQGLQTAILNLCKSQGYQLKSGTAPRTQQEREVRQMLD
jgi:hypothetical protein